MRFFSETTKTKTKDKSRNPTRGIAESEIDKLAKQWIELVLSHIQKAPVVFSKESSYNNVIG